MLNCVVHGSETGLPTLLIAHGLFGSARNWGAIAKRLSATRRVVALDMRNHGESPWSDRHDYPSMADDLAEVIGTLGAPVDLLGHSMGGKAAMWLALTQRALVRRLIVADIAPVPYAHSHAHLIAAMRGLPLHGLAGRGDADRRLAPAVPDAGTRAFLLQSLDLASDPARWRLNLEALDAHMGEITGWPEVAGRFDGPTLFLTGGLSDYVAPAHRPTITARFPKARFVRIPEAGHWLHAERPREFCETVDLFLTRP
jgi:pimeloyl-ACP methyl ester carboxylesterase